MSDHELGWFADTDPDANPEWPWQPVLQHDGGVASIGHWFRTRADCENWIREYIIGAPLIVDD